MTDLVESRRTEIEELCRRYRVSRLELFGSAATDRFEPDRSDLDFLVQFDQPSVVDHADRYFGLKEDLARLFARDIDLVELRAVHNPYFLQAVEASRRLLFTAAMS